MVHWWLLVHSGQALQGDIADCGQNFGTKSNKTNVELVANIS